MVDLVTITLWIAFFVLMGIGWFFRGFFEESGRDFSKKIFGEEQNELEESQIELNRKLTEYLDQQIEDSNPDKTPENSEVPLEEEKDD